MFGIAQQTNHSSILRALSLVTAKIGSLSNEMRVWPWLDQESHEVFNTPPIHTRT